MTSPMGPPMPAGYSLRVQLFAPNAYNSSDRPIRCFRVVAAPDLTVSEFCEEASRIHEINYGTPLALKKVQDDQQFDITQSEVLGNLFSNMSTIRCVQSAANPKVRDSVEPTSALRFDPSSIRKRQREEISRTNGSAPAGSWKSNKRQRVADPDEPLPSRETEGHARGSAKVNGIPDSNVIPNSQESVILGDPKRLFRNDRDTEIPQSEEILNQPTHANNSSPLIAASVRAQSNVPVPRAKSASYHIQRATERGRSVSTAATSPLSMDQRSLQDGGITDSTRVKSSSNLNGHARNNRLNSAQNEQSIYETMVSDDEGSGSALARTRQALKIRNSPSSLPDTEWAKNKFNTPPNGRRQSPASRERSTPKELPLTPNSKQREERKRQDASEARTARIAAAEAAEQRKRDAKNAEEFRQAEETRVAEEERSKREEQEHIEVEDFKRGEAERKTAAAKAARVEKEREARERKEAQEEKIRHDAQVAKEKADGEARVQEEERLAAEEAANEEAEKFQKEKEAAMRKSKSASPILSRCRGSSSVRPQSSTPFIPGSIRKSSLKRTGSSQAARSSSPAGSKASDGSSSGGSIDNQMLPPKPTNRRVSFREEPVPDRRESTIKPLAAGRIVPPPRIGTPKATRQVKLAATIRPQSPAAAAAAAKAVLPSSSAPRSSQSTPILPPTKVTAIPPPRRISSVAQSEAVPVRKEATSPVATKRISPVPATAPSQSITPAPRAASIARKSSTPVSAAPSSARKSTTPVPPPAAVTSARKSTTPIPPPKGKFNSIEPKPKQQPIVESSDDDSEEDIPSRASPKKISNRSMVPEQPIRAEQSVPEVESSDDEEPTENMEIDEDETQSQNSSIRDSRSPVIFSQHPKVAAPERSPSPEQDSVSESDADDVQDQQDSDAEDGSDLDADRTITMTKEEDENASSESNSDSEDEEDAEEPMEQEDQVMNSSPPVLPSHHSRQSSTPKPAGQGNNVTSKDPSSDSSGHNTQDELDQQLTSSLYEAHSAPPSSNTAAPPIMSSAATRPAMRFGASLSSLNLNKSLLSCSSAIQPKTARNGQRTLQLAEDENSGSSEEESDDDDSSSSDEGGSDKENPVARPTLPKVIANSSALNDASSDSDSNSNSDSDDEEDQQKKIRDELALEIAGLKKTDSEASFPSPMMYRTGTQQEGKTNAKKETKKKTDKYNTGYKFRMSN